MSASSKIIPFCFLPLVMWSGPKSKVDSLELLLKSRTMDSAVIKKCVSLIYDLNNAYEDIVPYGEKVLKMADAVQEYPAGQVRIRLVMANGVHLRGDESRASLLIDEAIAIAKDHNLKRLEAKSLRVKGNQFFLKGYFNKAFSCFKEGEAITAKYGAPADHASLIYFVGLAYWRLDQPVKALNYFQRSADIFDSLHDVTGYTKDLLGMGLIYHDCKQYPKAIELLRKVSQMRIQMGKPDEASASLLNIAESYFEMSQLDSSLFYIKYAIQLAEPLNVTNVLASAYASRGKIYLKREQEALSESDFIKSLKISREIQDKSGEALALSLICMLYEKKKLYTKMEKYIEKAIELNKDIGDSLQLKECYFNASRLYSHRKDFKRAYTYTLLFDSLNSRFFNSENNKVINEMLAKYEAKSKQRENEQLLKANALSAKIIEQQKWFFYLCPLGCVLVLLLIFFIVHWHRLETVNANLKVRSQETELIKLREMKALADLKTLQASINPHFLYNSFNSITSLIYEKPDQAEEMIIKLSHLFRYSINSQEANWATVAEELKIVQNYMDIESIRFGERIQYHVHADPSILNQLIPRFLLQPLVENAIRHGLKDKSKDGILSVMINDRKENIEIVIADNGIPFPKEITPGYGLQNIKDKLDLLYHDEWKMKFLTDPDKLICFEAPKIRKHESHF